MKVKNQIYDRDSVSTNKFSLLVGYDFVEDFSGLNELF